MNNRPGKDAWSMLGCHIAIKLLFQPGPHFFVDGVNPFIVGYGFQKAISQVIRHIYDGQLNRLF
jgi:hypothetical protein